MAPEKMRAIHITHPGGPEVLQPVEIEIPAPNEGQLLVKVEAAGVNRPDVLQRMGLYPAPRGASEIPGLEIAGRITAIGENAGRFKVGDEICALVSGGGYADYCLVDEPTALPIPDGLTLTEAAALPETFFTVWHNVFERGGLKPDEWFLIHGGTSGIGTTAIQLASAFGAKVIATAGSAKKCEACKQLGAVHAINYNEEDFPDIVKNITDGHGADVILDMVGGDYIERNFKAAAPDGRIVQIAFLNGATVKVNFTRLMLKRLTLTGSTLRARSLSVKSEIAKKLEEKVWPLIAGGQVKPVIDSSFPLDQATKAHAHMEASEHIGKIMLIA